MRRQEVFPHRQERLPTATLHFHSPPQQAPLQTRPLANEKSGLSWRQDEKINARILEMWNLQPTVTSET